MQGDGEKALEAGMDDHLPKPVTREELDFVLQRWVSREGATMADGTIANLRELGDRISSPSLRRCSSMSCRSGSPR